jgi:hypothetical protein
VTVAAFGIRFAEHIPHDRIDSLITSMSACGDVRRCEDGSYLIEVYRAGKLDWRQNMLGRWDANGSLSWVEHKPVEKAE